MLKGYFVKSIATATENNKNFAGETHTHYIGKGTWVYDEHVSPCWGWSQKRWAEKYIEERKHDFDYNWNYQYEIVEVIFADGKRTARVVEG